MLPSSEGITRAVSCAAATVVLSISLSGCTKPQPQPTSGSRTVANARGSDGQRSHYAGHNTYEHCDVGGGNPTPPSVIQPQDKADFATYRDDLCFIYDQTAGNNEWSDLKKTAKGVAMWIMPEQRTLATDPAIDAAQNQGMVVALVRNNGSKRISRRHGWRGRSLDPQQDALIWLSKDAKTAVLFTYGRDDKVQVLATGSWIPMPYDARVNPKPGHAKALWSHPRALMDSTQPRDSTVDPGDGWIACLNGCCTPGGLFISQ